MRHNCDHNACQSVTLTRDEIVITERPLLFVQPDGKPNTWLEVTTVDGRFLGEIHDQGYRKHISRGGDWVTQYTVIAGGSCVALSVSSWLEGRWVTTRENLEATVQEFMRWCQRVSFAHRMALHG